MESSAMPGYFLRHRNGEVWLDANDNSTLFKNDATWRIRSGFASPWAASFESYNIAGAYLRHRSGLLEISPVSSSLDQQDATFYVK
ncbi:AbfB domain-containing protein [Paenibacillus sp. CECT 9249]|uniref:AbfB domain-containing protein n=1 Tax=Paenibacillus sp. MSJ-34 TaxID=2841529 RepID=UPI0025B6E68C|nr:AbfB domain-containing protein [Paenibacillus sp. CECT 9249]